MRDPDAMGLVERIGEGGGDSEHLVERQWRLRPAEPRRQGLAVQMLHDQIVHTVVLAHVVYGADVRMVYRSDGACLALETGPRVGIVCNRCWKNLDRHRAIEAGVPGPVHLTHSTHADLGRDFVRAEAGAGCEGQTPGSITVRVAKTRFTPVLRRMDFRSPSLFSKATCRPVRTNPPRERQGIPCRPISPEFA